jgi:hypothetical protein
MIVSLKPIVAPSASLREEEELVSFTSLLSVQHSYLTNNMVSLTNFCIADYAEGKVLHTLDWRVLIHCRFSSPLHLAAALPQPLAESLRLSGALS